MREQLEHLKALSTEPHITVQVLPYTAGAHPGLPGQFSIRSNSTASSRLEAERPEGLEELCEP